MKILNVIHSLNPAGGGVAEFIKQCSQALLEDGHQPEAASCDAPDSKFLADVGIPAHGLGPGFLNYGYCSRFVPWLKEHAANYDAVIVHGLWQYNGLAVWRALHKSPIPYFVYPHGMLDPWFNKAYPLKHLKKIPYWTFAESKILRDSRAVLYTCAEERVLARRSFSNYRANDIVVNFGTRDPRFDKAAAQRVFAERFPQLAGKRYLLFLGRIQEKKGCDLLLQAFAKVRSADPDLHVVMAGPDQSGWRAVLESQIQSAGISSHVVWTGMLSGDAKWGAISGADAFVLPSHQENFGIATVEALACGVPVLISNKVNIWQEIKSDGVGLVEGDTLDGVTRMIGQWLALTPAQRKDMVERARPCFLRRFDIRAAAKAMIDALKSCGAGRGIDPVLSGKSVHAAG